MLDFYENQTTPKGHKSQNYVGIFFMRKNTSKPDLFIKSSVFLPFTNVVSLICLFWFGFLGVKATSVSDFLSMKKCVHVSWSLFVEVCFIRNE